MKPILSFLIAEFFALTPVFANAPEVNCIGLPGCPDSSIDAPSPANITGTKNIAFTFLGSIISNGIKYIAVIAVISLMLAGVKYIISMGDDEKVGKAKMWIIYSLVGVLLSVSAWTLVNIINDFRI